MSARLLVGGTSARAFYLALAACGAGLALVLLARSPAPELSIPGAGPPAQVGAERAYGELPLAFERDAGRSGPRVDFLARTPTGTAFVGAGGATLTREGGERTEAVRLALRNASASEPVALARLPGAVNDLTAGGGRTGIATFERVRYPEVYPGIAIDWRGDQRQLEYDFRLAPGADPGAIGLEVGGAERLRLAGNGDLVIDAGRAVFRQRAPVAFQTVAGERRRVEAAFTLDAGTVGFELGTYDRSRPLVIDPLVLAYSTYLGGAADERPDAIAVDSSGAAYVTGETASTDFDTVGAIEGNSAEDDVFVSKLNPAGSALVYSTYLGGDASDRGHAIAVDSTGAAYVTGESSSTDYCTGAGCSIEPNTVEVDGNDDVIVSKLNPGGSALVYSTYIGGDNIDFGNAIAVDSTGAAYVAGETESTDYNTVGPIETDSGNAAADAFVSKLNPAGSALVYSTYLGGNSRDLANGIAVDSTGAAYVVGDTESTDYCDMSCSLEVNSANNDAFVSKLNSAGSALAYSTYLGGGGYDLANEVAVDSSNAAYVAGETESTDFNTVGGIEGDSDGLLTDAFVSKFNPAGSALTYSTYLGGSAGDWGHGIDLDPSGAAYVTGQTSSTDFDTVGPIEGDSGDSDAFVSKLTPAGSALTYSTYVGGSGYDQADAIAVDGSGAAYVTGETASTNFDTVGPIEGDSGGFDVFISKLSFEAEPGPPPAKAERTITLDASKRKVRKGKKVGLSGEVNAAGDEAACEDGQTVELQRAKKGGAFKGFATDTTDAVGDFGSKVRVRKTFRYRAQLDETAACTGELSNTEKVKAKQPKR